MFKSLVHGISLPECAADLGFCTFPKYTSLGDERASEIPLILCHTPHNVNGIFDLFAGIQEARIRAQSDAVGRK